MIARALSAAGLVLAAGAAAEDRPPVSDGRYVMGTVLEIRLEGVEPEAGRALVGELFAEVSRLEGILSTWDPESAVSRLNRSAAEEPQAVPPEVTEVLRAALEGFRLSRGAFDVTVGPLAALWRRASERGALPPPDELAVARARVGSDGVRIGDDGRVSFETQGMSLDLGGIGKGYALDQLVPRLRARKVSGALLNFGQSSTWAVGAPPDAPGWRLVARGPGDALLGVLTLRDRALSVSGSLGQWVEIGGRRYGHVLDPRSGMPVEKRRQAVVVAPNAALAEILSTALLVLGEEDGVALVEARDGCEGLLVDADGGVFETRGFREAVAFEPIDAPARR